jgi:hypothetical protein
MNRLYEQLVQAGVIILMIALVYFGKAVSFYPEPVAITRTNLEVQNSPVSQSPYQLLWFEVYSPTIKLNYNIFLNPKPLALYALTKQATVIGIESGGLSENFSGSLAAVAAPFKVDLDRDGVMEKVRLVAKLDTLFTQGFTPPRTDFADSRIPLEIVFVKNNQLKVLFKGKPLVNQALRLISPQTPERKITTDASGSFTVNDLRCLAVGISVIFLNQDHTCYIASYMRDSYSLFTPGHMVAMEPLLKVIFISAIVISLLWGIGKFWPRRGRDCGITFYGDFSPLNQNEVKPK